MVFRLSGICIMLVSFNLMFRGSISLAF